MLNDVKCRNAAARAKPYKLNDSNGLYLYISPKGTKTWRFDYAYVGKRGTLTFGKYPFVTLADARDKQREAKTRLAQGTSPKASSTGETFDALADRWLASMKPAWTPRYYGVTERRIALHLRKPFGHRDPASITSTEVLAEIRKMEARGTLHMARVMHRHMSKMFRFGIAEGIVKQNPASDILDALSAPKPTQHRASIPVAKIPKFLDEMEAFDLDQDTRDALRLTILTAARTGEIRFASDEEFEGLDGDNPLWKIPEERMKMNNAHIVPLTPEAVAIVKRRLGRGMLFKRDTRRGVISENTMIYAMYRLGYHGTATVHGFRGSFSTAANEAGWNSDWIERCLAHVEQNKARGAYNAAAYLKQRRRLLNWWADLVHGRVPTEKPALEGE